MNKEDYDLRIRLKLFTLSRADLERYLINEHGLPEDIVVTGIDKPVNQEVWLIKVHSSKFNGSFDLDLSPTTRNDLLKPTSYKGKEI